MKTLVIVPLVLVIVIGASVGVGAAFAWAVTSIWPQLPFWPVAVGGMLVLGALSGNRSK
jgi:hypothetical protein